MDYFYEESKINDLENFESIDLILGIMCNIFNSEDWSKMFDIMFKYDYFIMEHLETKSPFYIAKMLQYFEQGDYYTTY